MCVYMRKSYVSGWETSILKLKLKKQLVLKKLLNYLKAMTFHFAKYLFLTSSQTFDGTEIIEWNLSHNS